MTKKEEIEWGKKIKTWTSEWKKKNPNYKTMKLTGRGHIKARSVIFNWDLKNVIPWEVKDSLYFTGQGQQPIVATDYAEYIAKKMKVPVGFIFNPVWDK